MSEPEKQTFKSVVFEKISPSIKEGIANLKVLERPVQSLSKGHVRVDVHASATNFFDLLMLVGQYQLKPKLPSGLGSEASGIISEVGPGVKYVAILLLSLHCPILSSVSYFITVSFVLTYSSSYFPHTLLLH